ncbi:MAG TPA: type II toxin-antitoxin system Phd/YefM family antitoxin [Terriglobales bacterium]|nr:type II toxin-antitoxin system Phd/YefM family antitoxin [Terriglobales bacterium]
MAKMSTSAARIRFSELVSKAEFAKERTTLHRRKKPVAAIVPIEDLRWIEHLERLEEEEDIRDAKKALRSKKRIPLEEVKRRLGMK